jgi:hypothetical protein
MISILYTGIMVLLWIINLFNGTGLDTIYHVTQYAKYGVIAIAMCCILMSTIRQRKFSVIKTDFLIFGSMFVVFCLSSYIHGYGSQAVDYLWVFCLAYLLSRLQLDKNVFLWTGIAYGIAGLFILYTYDYGTILSGWNENSIAMIGMHSFLIMIIPFFNKSSKLSKVILLAMLYIFCVLLGPTNSRSGILFLIVGALFAVNLIPRRLVYGSRLRRVFVLAVPLLIAILVSGFSGTALHTSLNVWSQTKFHKPIFNGRDEIWQYGFTILNNHLLFGAGSMDLYNWHKSAITCLTAFGVIGYILWICSFENIFGKAVEWLDDYLVQGCMISFMVLYLQQSVELGFMSSSPNLLPYVMLGMMLGSVRYLKNTSQESEALSRA